MKRSNIAITVVLILLMALTPIQFTHADPEPPKDDTWAALCIVACAGAAVGAIWVFSKRCQPKYYWLMDDSEQPPKFWVGAHTRKECDIQGWKRIGGPYNRPEDAPAVHPNATNRVSFVDGPAMNISVEQTTDFQNWTTVYQETCTLDDFGWCTTNAAMFRIKATP